MTDEPKPAATDEEIEAQVRAHIEGSANSFVGTWRGRNIVECLLARIEAEKAKRLEVWGEAQNLRGELSTERARADAAEKRIAALEKELKDLHEEADHR